MHHGKPQILKMKLLPLVLNYLDLSGSHALRGNPLGDALRRVPQERHRLHSHAKRGNEKGFYLDLIFTQHVVHRLVAR